QSGRTLEVAGASTANGALVDIWDSNNGANQKWNITPTDSGYYSVINVNSGKAMEVFGGITATNAGAAVDQWSGTQFNQQWSFQAP
ncbi:MAG TPA: RICIN domain-containing protein, partial [Methylomirabilota bacterium]|nr:RICIN domain-containing protein [Methylomirabilota bacterium]